MYAIFQDISMMLARFLLIDAFILIVQLHVFLFWLANPYNRSIESSDRNLASNKTLRGVPSVP